MTLRTHRYSVHLTLVNGAAATKEISCKMQTPIRADRQYVAGLGKAGMDMFDGMEKEMDLKGTGLEPYYYRDTLVAMNAHAVVLIGGAADHHP
jgi:glycerate-2-kinase